MLAEDLFERQRTADRRGVGFPRSDRLGVHPELAGQLIAAPAESQPVVPDFRAADGVAIHGRIFSTICASGRIAPHA
jgi:hypothetical protein